MTHVFCNKKEIPTITAIVNKNNPHHIVGVQALCSCSFENITALSHVAESLRIVFPAFRFFSSFIYNGYSSIVIVKVAIVKLRIKSKLFNILILF